MIFRLLAALLVLAYVTIYLKVSSHELRPGRANVDASPKVIDNK